MPPHVPAWAAPFADRVEAFIDGVEAPFRDAVVRTSMAANHTIPITDN